MEVGSKGPWGGSTKVLTPTPTPRGFVRFSDPTFHFTDDKPRPERPKSLTVPELSEVAGLGVTQPWGKGEAAGEEQVRANGWDLASCGPGLGGKQLAAFPVGCRILSMP